MWPYGWELLILYHQFAKSGGNRRCSSWDVKFLICHLILQDHVIKGSFDFMNRSSLKVSHLPAKFVGHRHCGSRDIVFSVVGDNSECRHSHLPVCPAIVTRVYSNQIPKILRVSDKLSYGIQRRIHISFKHLWWRLFAKIVNR